MSTITEAVELVNQQARAFKAVQVVADVIRQIGDLETRLAGLNDDVAAALSKVMEVQAYSASVQQKCQDDCAAIERAAQAREQATTAALEQARVDAAAVIERAKTDAKAASDEAALEVQAANDLLVAKGAELRDVNAKIDAANVQLGGIQERLVAAQEAVRKMLGGS